MEDALRTVLRDNVLALLRHRTGEFKPNETGVTRLVNLGIAPGSAQRTLEASTSIGIRLLQELAAALEVKPWQLLIPGLDPKALPGLTADPSAWPFLMVDRRAYRALSEAGRGYVQGAMSKAIEDARAAEKRKAA